MKKGSETSEAKRMPEASETARKRKGKGMTLIYLRGALNQSQGWAIVDNISFTIRCGRCGD
jgi:hypothetical protein